MNGESKITLTEASKTCPHRRGRHPHVSTIWRWCRVGVRARSGERIRLEHCRVGGSLFTSAEALERFFTAVAEADREYFDAPSAQTAPNPSSRFSRQNRSAERAEIELNKAGI